MRRPNLGLVCFVLMFTVFLVKDACLFSSCWFSFSLVMHCLGSHNSVRLSHACFVTNPKNLLAIFLYLVKEQSF